jgi:hypothetical protein
MKNNNPFMFPTAGCRVLDFFRVLLLSLRPLQLPFLYVTFEYFLTDPPHTPIITSPISHETRPTSGRTHRQPQPLLTQTVRVGCRPRYSTCHSRLHHGMTWCSRWPTGWMTATMTTTDPGVIALWMPMTMTTMILPHLPYPGSSRPPPFRRSIVARN